MPKWGLISVLRYFSIISDKKLICINNAPLKLLVLVRGAKQGYTRSPGPKIASNSPPDFQKANFSIQGPEC